MTNQTNTGTPGGAPVGGPPSSFVAQRSQQLAQSMERQPAPSSEPPADRQPQQQPQQQQAPGDRRMIEIGGNQYDEADVQSAIAERAEAQVRKSGLPAAPEGYEVRNSADFQLPEGVSKFEFNLQDPALAAARKFALSNNLTQRQFEGMLDLFVASKSGELLNQVRAREANLAQLGVAAPQRIDAIATWLSARAGKDGAAVGSFLRQFPSAPIVKAMETLIRQFSSQGGADFSQSGRAEQEDAGKIPGYESMSFAQKRAFQMAQMLNKPGYRGGSRGER